MPTYQYPCSLVAQFSEDVYKNVGMSDVLPLVMKSVDADKIRGVQFLRAGKVRLTFEDVETCSAVLKNGLDLGDVPVQLFPADDRVRIIHLRDLPVEVDHDSVSTFFSAYGEVLSIDHCHFEEYPSVRNGNRLIKILLTQDIPYFVEVEGCNCRVWYPRQPAQCSICREFGHRAPACPLSGRCRRCHQPGHVARECTQAWGPLYSAPRTVVSQDLSMESEDVPDNFDAGSSKSEDVPVTTAAATASVSCSLATATVSTFTTAVPVSTAAATDSTSRSTVTATATTFSTAVPVAVLPNSDASASIASVTVTDSTSARSSDTSSPKVFASKPNTSRRVITAESFCDYVTENYSESDLPVFDNVHGHEWKSRAKSHIRQQLKIMFEEKLTIDDIASWSDNEYVEVNFVVCNVLSFQDRLRQYVFDMVKRYWHSARKHKRT